LTRAESRPGLTRRMAAYWLRFDDELTACPGCGSARIALLEPLSIPRMPDRRKITFATGCRSCGLLFANPLPTREHLSHFYSTSGPWAETRTDRLDRLARSYSRKAEPVAARSRRRREAGRAAQGGPEPLLTALAAHVPVDNPDEGARVLDFGCGDGKLLNRLQDRGWDTFGIEPSTDVPFIRHRRLDAPPQDASFALAILHHVLEHVPDPLQVLGALAGALRPGGTLVISVPRIDTLPVHRDWGYCLDGRRHIMGFTERCLSGLLIRAGFGDIERLDVPEIDERQTQGQPLRLRIVAKRTGDSQAPPLDDPLAPALDALSAYFRVADGMAGRVRRVLPVRLRAALEDRFRDREAERRRVQRR